MYKTIKCRKYSALYPNITPIVTGISNISSDFGNYITVYISGYNFDKNTSTLYFNDFYNAIPIDFYNSQSISFNIPPNIPIGSYNIYVVNSFYNQLNAVYLRSNSITYTVQ